MSSCPARRTRIATAVMVMVAGLAGCSTAGPDPWQVQPTYKVVSTGQAASDGYVALARQYEGERLWRRARDAWLKASLAAPDDAEILNSLAMAEAAQGRFAESVAALRRAVALEPQSPRLLNNLGYALQLAGRPKSRALSCNRHWR